MLALPRRILYCLQPALHEVLSRDSFCAPEVDIFHAVKRWSGHNPEEDPKAVIEVSECVCVHAYVHLFVYKVTMQVFFNKITIFLSML